MEGKTAMMGATIAMVAAVAMVLLVLLAELYCTLLLRRRRRHHPHTTLSSTTSSSGACRLPGSPSPLCTFYAQGVIRAPRTFLFPADAPPPPQNPNSEKQLFHNYNLRYSSAARLDHREAASPQSSTTSAAEQLMYICNPMYDGKRDTPFETPDSSPSHFDIETGSSSGGSSPPSLTPPPKHREEGASVSLRDGGSICTTPSDSNTIFGGVSSSSSSPSPSNSPSW